MDRAPKALLLSVIVAGAVAGAFVMTRGDRPARPARVAREREAPPARAAEPAPVAPAVPAAQAPIVPEVVESLAEPDAVAALRDGLASEDVATRIAAIEAAVGATATETLPVLEAFDLKSDPEVAPRAIYAVALLGASGDEDERDEAASTLAQWLHDEQRREGPDVPGNVSNLVEAIGDTGGSNAVAALGAVLKEGTLPLHVQTLAVQKLGELADAQAREPVEQFASRVAALPPAEGLDEELRVEAAAAARETLSKI